MGRPGWQARRVRHTRPWRQRRRDRRAVVVGEYAVGCTVGLMESVAVSMRAVEGWDGGGRGRYFSRHRGIRRRLVVYDDARRPVRSALGYA